MKNDTQSTEWVQVIRASVAAPDLPESFLADLDRRVRTRQTDRARRIGFQRRMFAAAAGSIAMLAVIAAAVAGPDRVIAAVRNAFGFIPGIGFVSGDAPVRVLAEPVRVARDGIAVTLTGVLVDDDQTKISYLVEGLPRSTTAPSTGEETCPGTSILALPDGRRLAPFGGGGGPLDSPMPWNESFPSLPPSVMEATLIIPCIPLTPAGAFPGNWEIPFRLVLAEAPVLFQTVAPMPTVTPGPTNAATVTMTEPSTAFPGIRIGVDRISEFEDGYLLVGVIDWEAEQKIADAFGSTFTLTDRDGRILPVEDAGGVPEEPAAPNSAYWSLRVSGKNLRGPVTVKLDSLYIVLRDPLTFSFDVGENPEAGQEWEIGKSFSVGGYPLTVQSAKYIIEGNLPGFSVSVRLPPDIFHVVVGAQNPAEAGGGPQESLEPGIYRWGVFLQAPPTGRVDLFIQQMTIGGEWMTTWDPPGN